MLTIFKTIRDRINPIGVMDYREYLQHIYNEAKKADPQYTYHRLASDLGFPPTGIIHQMIKGRRKLSEKNARKIADSLGLKPIHKSYFLHLVAFCNAEESSDSQKALAELLAIISKDLPSEINRHYLKYMSHWQHVVIREMVALPSFKADPAWIAKELIPKISEDEVKESLDLLQQLDLIRTNHETGKVEQTSERMVTSPNVSGTAITHCHQQFIELGKESLSKTDRDDRYVCSTTLRVTADQLEAIKSKIHALNMEILAMEAPAEESENLFQLNVQFFPLTHVSKKSE